MPISRTCIRCGDALSADAPLDVCPRCVAPQVLGLNSADAVSDLKASIPSRCVSPEEQPGDLIGPYKLLQKIGEGGCGVVYMAEQLQPIHRRVALKIIKLGMDTRQVVARFEAERQALAMMDHPNIARVLDAGATATGRPYFVMELVRGVRINDYCDEANLSTPDRLQLFIQVCQAVQHAHQKSIVHRDLKPSNILVTINDGIAVPKVIDFGIAKAVAGQQLTDKTLFTAFEQFIGTPAYMSPEQAMMTSLDIDTRSDIYSLGVLLYELLTGKTPFDHQALLQAGFDALRRTIQEQEPARPSVRLSTLPRNDLTTVAKRRSTDVPKLIHAVEGDLDWIVMKCLEKDRTRRYDTATGLAADLQRHLNNEPITARPPSNIYRFQKLVQRNQVAFLAGAAVGAALVVGLCVASWQAVSAIRAQQATKIAEEESRLQAGAARRERDRAVQAESRARQEAKVARNRALEARRNLYAADMNVAQRAAQYGHWGRVKELVGAHFPKAGDEDLRGFEWRYLWGLSAGDQIATLRGHKNVVCALEFSPNGKTILSASQDRTVRLWDVATRDTIATLPQFPWRVLSAAFHPDGKLFAVGAMRDGVTLWSTDELKLIARLPVKNAFVAFSPDGTRLAAAERTALPPGTGIGATVWNVATRKVEMTFEVPTSEVAFSPSGKLLATGSTGEVVTVWRLDDHEPIAKLQNPSATWWVSFVANDETLVSCHDNGDTLVWNVPNQTIRARLSHNGKTWQAKLSPDGKTLATVSDDQMVRLWDVDSWQLVTEFRGHGNEVWCVDFSPDGKTLATGSKDETIKLWPTRPQPRPATTFSGVLTHPLFSQDGSLVIAVGADEHIHLWNTYSGEDEGTLEKEAVPIGFLPESGELVTWREPGTCTVWDLHNRVKRNEQVLPINEPVRWAKLSPDGRVVVVGNSPSDDNRAWVFHLGTQRLEAVIPRHTDGPESLAFSPNSRYLLTADIGRATLLNALSWSKETEFAEQRMSIRCSDVAPNGELIATGGPFGTVELHDPMTGFTVCALTGHSGPIGTLRFSPDGRTLATSSGGSVILWNVATRREMLSFTFDDEIIYLAFSGDGRLLYIGGKSLPGEMLRAPTFAEIDAVGAAH